jgi:hypothetical protein
MNDNIILLTFWAFSAIASLTITIVILIAIWRAMKALESIAKSQCQIAEREQDISQEVPPREPLSSDPSTF